MLVKRKLARRKGGVNRRKIQQDGNTSFTIDNYHDLIKIIETTIEDVMDLNESGTRDTILGYLFKVLIQTYDHSDKEELNQLKWRLEETERNFYRQLYFSNYLNDDDHIFGK